MAGLPSHVGNGKTLKEDKLYATMLHVVCSLVDGGVLPPQKNACAS